MPGKQKKIHIKHKSSHAFLYALVALGILVFVLRETYFQAIFTQYQNASSTIDVLIAVVPFVSFLILLLFLGFVFYKLHRTHKAYWQKKSEVISIQEYMDHREQESLQREELLKISKQQGDLKERMKQVANLSLDLVKAEDVVIWWYDLAENTFVAEIEIARTSAKLWRNSVITATAQPGLFQYMLDRQVLNAFDVKSEALLQEFGSHFWEERGIQSFLLVPVGTEENLYGYLGFASIQYRNVWPDWACNGASFTAGCICQLVENQQIAQQKKQAEETERHFASLFLHSLQPIARLQISQKLTARIEGEQLVDVLKQKLCTVEANTAFIALWGLSKEQVGKTLLKDVLGQAVMEELIRLFVDHNRQPVSLHAEVEVKGTRKWLNLYLVEEQEGPEQGSFWITALEERDIPPEVVLDAEEQDILQNSPNVYLLTDEHGEIRYASKETVNVLGRLPEDLLGKPWLSLVHASDKETAIENFRKMQADPKAVIHMEIAMEDVYGEKFLAETISKNVVKETKVTGFLFEITDVTEKAQREFETNFRANFYQLIAETTSSIVCFIDANYTIKYINPASKEVLGYELKGLVNEWLPSTDFEWIKEELDKVAQTPEYTYQCITQLMDKDGYWRDVALKASNAHQHSSFKGLVLEFNKLENASQESGLNGKLLQTVAHSPTHMFLRLGPKGEVLNRVGKAIDFAELKNEVEERANFYTLLASEQQSHFSKMIRQLDEGGILEGTLEVKDTAAFSHVLYDTLLMRDPVDESVLLLLSKKALHPDPESQKREPNQEAQEETDSEKKALQKEVSRLQEALTQGQARSEWEELSGPFLTLIQNAFLGKMINLLELSGQDKESAHYLAYQELLASAGQEEELINIEDVLKAFLPIFTGGKFKNIILDFEQGESTWIYWKVFDLQWSVGELIIFLIQLLDFQGKVFVKVGKEGENILFLIQGAPVANYQAKAAFENSVQLRLVRFLIDQHWGKLKVDEVGEGIQIEIKLPVKHRRTVD
ncbi:PAS domain S-box protein [Rapidithrix thailandica]|uniref:PAS domain S-box protein n=1 Tax=Rapidithrix thailandica TaxID=413964 RepID=A0AAW9RYW1_9BACT